MKTRITSRLLIVQEKDTWAILCTLIIIVKYSFFKIFIFWTRSRRKRKSLSMKSRIISLLLITREEDTWAILCIISLQLSFLFATKYVFVFRILLSDLLFPKHFEESITSIFSLSFTKTKNGKKKLAIINLPFLFLWIYLQNELTHKRFFHLLRKSIFSLLLLVKSDDRLVCTKPFLFPFFSLSSTRYGNLMGDFRPERVPRARVFR